MEFTERDQQAIKEYLGYIRAGSKRIYEIDDSRYRDEIAKLMQEDVDAGRSTGHERRALREYNERYRKD